MITHLDNQNLALITVGNNIVFFHSLYCKICTKEKEILDFANIDYYGVNCDEDPEFYITNYNVDLIPVLRIYENGKIVWERVDIISPEDLEFIKQYAEH